jgi:hypothetical protein
VANVEIALVIAASSVLLVWLVLRVSPGTDRRCARALIGLVPGALGAFLVLTTNVDLIPDELESRALPLVIVAISAVVALITIRGLVRR